MNILSQLAPLALSLLFTQGDERRPLSRHPEAAGEASAAVEGELRIYEVGHLLDVEPVERLTRSLAASAGQTAGTAELEQLEELEMRLQRVDSTVESLTLAIRDMMQPPFVEEQSRIVRIERGKLAVVVRPEQHAWLAAFLDHASRFDGVVDVQARIVRLEPGRLAELERARSGEVLGEAEARQLLERLDRDEAEMVVAPRVLTFPFQRAELTVGKMTAYIRDYELKVLPGQDAEIADPVIDTVHSGMELNLRCVPLASGELSLDAKVVHAKVAEPIPTREVTIGAAGHRVTLQVPEVTRVKLEGRFEVRPGQTLVMASTDPESEQEVLVLVRAELVEELPRER